MCLLTKDDEFDRPEAVFDGWKAVDHNTDGTFRPVYFDGLSCEMKASQWETAYRPRLGRVGRVGLPDSVDAVGFYAFATVEGVMAWGERFPNEISIVPVRLKRLLAKGHMDSHPVAVGKYQMLFPNG